MYDTHPTETETRSLPGPNQPQELTKTHTHTHTVVTLPERKGTSFTLFVRLFAEVKLAAVIHVEHSWNILLNLVVAYRTSLTPQSPHFQARNILGTFFSTLAIVV